MKNWGFDDWLFFLVMIVAAIAILFGIAAFIDNQTKRITSITSVDTICVIETGDGVFGFIHDTEYGPCPAEK